MSQVLKLVMTLALTLALIIPLSGCGTLMSRGSGSILGAYPFQAVATDVAMMSGAYESDYEKWLMLGLVSTPVDLVLDLVLSPIDLIAWGMGARKERRSPDKAK